MTERRRKAIPVEVGRSVAEWIGATPDTAIPRRVRWISKRVCKIDECGKPVDSHGLCSGHANRLRCHGDPLGGSTPRGAAAAFMHDVAIKYDGDECLRWPFGNNGKGYGVFHVEKKIVSTHVYVCTVVHGERPSPRHEVAHSCGNGHMLCCAPRHLRWATRSENHADKVKHGTVARGQKNPASKLTTDDVHRIRALLGTRPQHAIASMFGVCPMTVSHIATSRSWGWLE